MPPVPRLLPAAKLMLDLGGETVSSLVQWLDEKRNFREIIEVKHHSENRWIVELRDTMIGDCAEAVMAFFTVDIKLDEIIWNTQISGNCGVRSERWYRKLRANFLTAEACSGGNKASGDFWDLRIKQRKRSAVR